MRSAPIRTGSREIRCLRAIARRPSRPGRRGATPTAGSSWHSGDDHVNRDRKSSAGGEPAHDLLGVRSREHRSNAARVSFPRGRRTRCRHPVQTRTPTAGRPHPLRHPDEKRVRQCNAVARPCRQAWRSRVKGSRAKEHPPTTTRRGDETRAHAPAMSSRTVDSQPLAHSPEGVVDDEVAAVQPAPDTKVQPAPCHRPPSSMVTIRLT